MECFINIEKEKRKKILEDKIDFTDYLGFHKDRGRLIPYGIGLGLSSPVPLKSKDSLYRPSYINVEMETLLTCAAIYNMDDNDSLNEFLTDKKIGEIADACLNKGLDLIEYEIDDISAENYQLSLLSDLYDLYEENLNCIK